MAKGVHDEKVMVLCIRDGHNKRLMRLKWWYQIDGPRAFIINNDRPCCDHMDDGDLCRICQQYVVDTLNKTPDLDVSEIIKPR